MSVEDAFLFIDANKYLDLYRMDKGKKLLAPLGELADHILVTQQVVNEVQRNKIQVAADHLRQKVMKLQTFNVPDHLCGTSADQGHDILSGMKEIVQKIKTVNREVDELAMAIVERISRSEDEVSKALAPIFAKAVPHSPQELERARYRRELGNPPGEFSNPLGDQLTWEQVLTHFKGKKRLWIISRDGDFCTTLGDRLFLNRFLAHELEKLSPGAQVFPFHDTSKGIDHFINETGVKAEKRLTPEETKEVENEEKALPPTIFESLRRMVEADIQKNSARTAEMSATKRMLERLVPIGHLQQIAEETTTRKEMLERMVPTEQLRHMAAEAANRKAMIERLIPPDYFRQVSEKATELQRIYDSLRHLME